MRGFVRSKHNTLNCVDQHVINSCHKKLRKKKLKKEKELLRNAWSTSSQCFVSKLSLPILLKRDMSIEVSPRIKRFSQQINSQNKQWTDSFLKSARKKAEKTCFLLMIYIISTFTVPKHQVNT